MKISEHKTIEWFLRIALSAGLLSAVADRFGLWSKNLSAWGNWANFVTYTQKLNPLLPSSIIPIVAILATALEVLFAILLLSNFKTYWVAKACGILLLIFGLAMSCALSIKAPLDYSVFSASAAAFALSIMLKTKTK